MKVKRKLLWLWFMPVLVSSCTVTNNIYVTDPVPIGKDNLELYTGVGSGLTPQIDTTYENGDVQYSNKLTLAPNICFGGTIGLGEQTDLRFNFHFPWLISGFGLHAGVQYSFFRKWTLFNAAVGADLGGVFAKDTLSLGKIDIALDPSTKGAINADLFLPVSYSFSKNYRIILTPRLSCNTIYIKRNRYESKSRKYSPVYLALSLGVRLNRFYLESTVQYIDHKILPGFGAAFTFDRVNDSAE